MADIEKILNALRHCLPETDSDINLNGCFGCPYDDECRPWEEEGSLSLPIVMVNDIKELLNEQYARVLTYDELFHEETFCVWYEEWGVPNVFQVACVDGEYEDMNVHYAIEDNEENRAEYGKSWRMWTLRPTEEQRKAIPWETH